MFVETIYIIFFTALFTQLYFYIFVYSKIIFHTPIAQKKPSKAVSVIIAAHNEAQNLEILIPLLLNQKYPIFEIIIVNDRSTDNTIEILKKYSNAIIYLTIDKTPNEYNSKKYALTKGIEKSKYPHLLFTDCDCRPASDVWIATMTSQLNDQIEIVIGVSPYIYDNTLINKIIQYETFETAKQYISLALNKQPYMGVGRNLLYTKTLFEKNGFGDFKNILGGDDDLFISQHANKSNTATCIHPKAYMLSVPKTSFRSWLNQKHRHLSVGKYYRLKYKLILGSIHASNMIYYICAILLIAVQGLNFITTTGIILRTFAQILIFGLIIRKLKFKISIISIPLLDLSYTFYSLIIGMYSSVIRKKKWK